MPMNSTPNKTKIVLPQCLTCSAHESLSKLIMCDSLTNQIRNSRFLYAQKHRMQQPPQWPLCCWYFCKASCTYCLCSFSPSSLRRYQQNHGCVPSYCDVQYCLVAEISFLSPKKCIGPPAYIYTVVGHSALPDSFVMRAHAKLLIGC